MNDPILPLPVIDLRVLAAKKEGGTMQTTPKPGYQTTEFWLALLATVLTALVASGAIPTSSPVQGYITEALFVLGALGYHAGRIVAKATAGDAAPTADRVVAVDPVTGRAS